MKKNFLNLNNPIRLFYFVSLAIFFVELGIMLFFQYFVISPSLIVNLIDSFVLILILYPVLYLFIFKPLVLQNIELKISKTDIEIKQAKYEAILTSIGEGMIVMDKDKKIIFFNKFAEEMMGWMNGNSVGMDFYKVIKIEDEEGNPISLEKDPVNIVISSKKRLI